MALASQTALSRRVSRILPPYNTLELQAWFPFFRLLLFVAMSAMIIYASGLVSLGGTALIKVAAIPISILMALVLWLLPDVDRHAKAPAVPRILYPIALVFACTIVIWPTYMAIVIPGLPWITPPRMVLAVLLLVMLVHFSQHSLSRQRIADIYGYDKIAVRFLLVFWLLNALISMRADHPGDTLYFIALQEVMGVSVALPIGLYLHNRANFKPVYAVVTCGCIYSMVVGVVENYMQIPPWAEHIPSFMQIDDEWLARILSPQARVGDDRYRIRSTFPVVLYYALYLSLTMPLVVFAIGKMRGKARLLGIALIPLIMHTVWFANARSAMIALLIPLFAYPAMILLRSFRRGEKIDVLKTAVRGAVILMLVGMLGGVIATSHRAQVAIFGGKQHAGSNDVRAMQWANAWDQLRKDPIGIGINHVQETVGVQLRGRRILDSYWINVLVGVGPLGFFLFYGLLLRCAYLGVVCFLRARNDMEEWAGAAAVGLFGYTVDQYVISNSDSIYLVYLFCALIIATKRLQDQRIAEEQQALKAPTSALVPRRN